MKWRNLKFSNLKCNYATRRIYEFTAYRIWIRSLADIEPRRRYVNGLADWRGGGPIFPTSTHLSVIDLCGLRCCAGLLRRLKVGDECMFTDGGCHVRMLSD